MVCSRQRNPFSKDNVCSMNMYYLSVIILFIVSLQNHCILMLRFPGDLKWEKLRKIGRNVHECILGNDLVMDILYPVHFDPTSSRDLISQYKITTKHQGFPMQQIHALLFTIWYILHLAHFSVRNRIIHSLDLWLVKFYSFH